MPFILLFLILLLTLGYCTSGNDNPNQNTLSVDTLSKTDVVGELLADLDTNLIEKDIVIKKCMSIDKEIREQLSKGHSKEEILVAYILVGNAKTKVKKIGVRNLFKLCQELLPNFVKMLP